MLGSSSTNFNSQPEESKTAGTGWRRSNPNSVAQGNRRRNTPIYPEDTHIQAAAGNGYSLNQVLNDDALDLNQLSGAAEASALQRILSRDDEEPLFPMGARQHNHSSN